jgi:hypothetical protein
MAAIGAGRAQRRCTHAVENNDALIRRDIAVAHSVFVI